MNKSLQAYLIFPAAKMFKLIHVDYDMYYSFMCWGLLSNYSIRVIRL